MKITECTSPWDLVGNYIWSRSVGTNKILKTLNKRWTDSANYPLLFYANPREMTVSTLPYLNNENKLYLTRVTLNSEITDKPVALGFQIELEFGNVGFWGEGKTGEPGEKPLGARTRTNKKQQWRSKFEPVRFTVKDDTDCSIKYRISVPRVFCPS